MHFSAVIVMTFMAVIPVTFSEGISQEQVEIVQLIMCLNETEIMADEIVDCMRKSEGFERYDEIQMRCLNNLSSPQSDVVRDYICESDSEDLYKGMVCMEEEMENAPDKKELEEHMKSSQECFEDLLAEWLTEFEESENEYD
ncbi:hypothetical protein X975_18870, partial [Stegodyphus mimosarum]